MQEIKDARYEMDPWMDGWMDGWPARWMDGQADRQTDTFMNVFLGQQAQCYFARGPTDATSSESVVSQTPKIHFID